MVSTVPAQVEFHGEIYPFARVTFKNHYISLPHRFASVELSRRGQQVSLHAIAAIEYRPGRDSVTLDLREAYAEISTSLGDIRLGKQILAWGAADGNNPTDNVNPYDFYYLFLAGAERKRGNLSLSANLYLGALNAEAVVTPFFLANRLPLNEPDFPIFADASNGILSIRPSPPSADRKNTEYGLRLRLPLAALDISMSYFRGFDRMFTPSIQFPPSRPDTTLSYLATRVIGGDLVTFLGDWGLRGEAAYFLTEDREGTDPFIRNPYLQYVLQLDRMTDDYSLVLQYLGIAITKIDDDDLVNPVTQQVLFTEKEQEWDNIPPKMGMPFGALAQNAVLASANVDFAGGRHTLQGQALYDLDHNGYMLGGKVTFGLEDAFDLEVGLVAFGGDEESRLHNLKDPFSHIYLGMKYSF